MGSTVTHSIIDVENEESETQQADGSSGKESGKETAAPGVVSTSTPSTADDPAARRVQTAAIVMSTFLQLLDYGTDCYLYFSFCPMLYHWELPGDDLWER